MKAILRHEHLAEGQVEARAYQLEAVDEALSGSSLLVLPTAAGKTAVAWLTIAEMLRRTEGWALMLAPTVALVKQHMDDLERVFAGSGIKPLSMSGAVSVEKNVNLYGVQAA